MGCDVIEQKYFGNCHKYAIAMFYLKYLKSQTYLKKRYKRQRLKISSFQCFVSKFLIQLNEILL